MMGHFSCFERPSQSKREREQLGEREIGRDIRVETEEKRERVCVCERDTEVSGEYTRQDAPPQCAWGRESTMSMETAKA